MENEVLAKPVIHNVVVCIHETYTLGIDPGFGGKPQPEPEDRPWVVRFPAA